MGVMLAFAFGYVVGAKAGQQGYDELLESVRAVRDSDEFRGFVSAARSHLSATFGNLSERVAEGDDALRSIQELVGRAKGLFEPTAAGSGGTGPARGDH